MYPLRLFPWVDAVFLALLIKGSGRDTPAGTDRLLSGVFARAISQTFRKFDKL
jgi:hypothetical protein